MKLKIVYIISDIDRAVGFEDIHTYLQGKFSFTFILLNKSDSYFEKYCHSKQIPCYRVNYHGKKSILRATLKTYSLLKKIKPDIVHTHLLDASLVGLTASRLAGITKRIHTRHHSDYHHAYFPHAIKYDKYINRMSHKIIAVSPSVRKILIELENVPEKKVVTICHGFKINEFNEVTTDRINSLNEKYNPTHKSPVIGVISRYTEWKGIQNIIPAFKELLKEYPNALLIMANAKGAYQHQIHKLLEDLPKENYREIAFEHDLHALYKLFTVFVHVPITETAEAFGQVYIEALLSKVPCVYTKSGIANTFENKEKICLFVRSQDNSLEIKDAIAKLINDKQLAASLSGNGYQYASENFGLEHQMLEFEKTYKSL